MAREDVILRKHTTLVSLAYYCPCGCRGHQEGIKAAEGMVPASNGEAVSDGETTQKPKKAKPRVQDDIDIDNEMKKIEGDTIRKKVDDMAKADI